MNLFGASIGFLSPLLLLSLICLPILWWLLRAVPPAPNKKRFPAVALLIGLKDKETTPDVTPWWLLLLRMLAVAAAIIGFSGPILNPKERVAGIGPMLIGMDASWASAQDWSKRVEKLSDILREAEQDGRPVAVVKWSDRPKEAELEFSSARNWTSKLPSLNPNAWGANYEDWRGAVETAEPTDIVWFSDGLGNEAKSNFMRWAADVADVTIVEGGQTIRAIEPLRFEDGALKSFVLSQPNAPENSLRIALSGPDPSGIRRDLETQQIEIEEGATRQEVSFELPTELRNRVRQIRIEGVRSAGAVSLTDDAIQRRKVALLAGAEAQEGGNLLSPLHYLRKALIPTADVIEAELSQSLLATPDVIVLADIGTLSDSETQSVLDWIDEGGTLLRFAGPRLTASQIGLNEEHPLLPVRLRAGGRSLGGAMSWGEPRKLRAFDETSPFFGLTIPPDVTVSSQVVAQPGPELANRVLASLADGTPLVTAKEQGLGRIILFHVTANVEWSTLPLSGLFVQMLERLAISARPTAATPEDLIGLTWTVDQVMDGFGELRDASGFAGVDGAELAEGVVSASVPAGVYANQDRRVAINVVAPNTELKRADWPLGTTQIGLVQAEEQPLKALLLAAALCLLMVDILATLFLGGRLRLAATVLALGLVMPIGSAKAQTESDLLGTAANNTVLAYVETGDAKLDEKSRAAMLGLSTELFRRTSIEPINPIGVKLASDDLSLYPFIYWPISTAQVPPSDNEVAKLNAFLRRGGMILFDTQDANIGGTVGQSTPNGRKLREIAARLDVPRLEPIPSDHVLTRAFYLLQEFPGRYVADVWVEAAPPDAEQIEGIPFRNLNDGVTPVVIGASDWAAAWAIDERGNFMFPVGRGLNGERQREIALRFGVNLLMYVMTGNYKSDQVHVPALLDRLGQ